jgi:hypothetical protein
MTQLPCFPVNLPPHHLTHWTPEALRDLAGRTGLVVEGIHEDLLSETDDGILWMHHHAPRLMAQEGDFTRLDRHALWSLVVSHVRTRLLSRNRAFPRGPDDALNLLMVARVPA